MTTKHTPGPWIWADGYRGLYGAGPDNAVLDYVGYEGMSLGVKNDHANARLIAAAPMLLEALILAEDVLSRSPFTGEIWPNGTHPNAGITQIRAAIAAATGDA